MEGRVCNAGSHAAAHLLHVLLEQGIQVLKSHSRIQNRPVAPSAGLLVVVSHVDSFEMRRLLVEQSIVLLLYLPT